ncbi:MAG: hypothetical protein H5T80_15100, partial [Dietzia sp.]|nr:hypothetical protein [Dietzia sp.]
MAEKPVSGVEIAERFKIAQSWWVASELARRNPHLFIHEWHPGGGSYDCLGLVDDRAPTDGIVLDLNRAGSLHVLKPEEATVAAWWELVGAEDPHLIVKRVERAAGLAPIKRPQTTDRSLTYRAITQALATAVNDRHIWDARSLYHDTSGDWDEGAERQAWVSSFPTALAMTRRGAL